MNKVIGVALFVALFASCRWSGNQQGVYDSYTRMSAALEDCRWEDLHDGLSRETRATASNQKKQTEPKAGDRSKDDLLARVKAMFKLWKLY